MKKAVKAKKTPSTPKEKKPDISEMIGKILEQLSNIERKVDQIMNRSQERVNAGGPAQAPAPRPEHINYNKGNQNQDLGFNGRRYHKAICADCRKECEVPFKPSGDRPVFCKECFSKRKTSGTLKDKLKFQPQKENVPQTPPVEKVEPKKAPSPSSKKKVVRRKK